MQAPSIPTIISTASSISVVLPLAMYFIRMKNAARRIHIIGALVMVSAVCDIIGMILIMERSSTVVLFNTYYALLFLLLTWFYYEILFINTRRVLVWIGLAIYLQSFLLVTIYVQSFFEYQTLMWVITAIIMIIYSISYFFYSFSTISAGNIFSYTFIWINIGVMIYFCLNLFLFVMGSHVLTKLEPQVGALIWSSHNVNNILKNVLFAIGIYFYRRKIADF
jgi:hypothetical protein